MEQSQLIEQLRNGDERAFEMLFKQHYEALCRYANGLLNDLPLAEEIVQDVFVTVWEKREKLEINVAFRPYIYKAVHNRCLNQIQHYKIRQIHQQEVLYTHSEAQHPQSGAEFNQLKTQFQKALQKLPEECGKVFRLSRENEFSYREIAEFLNISVKTVENQMGKALRIMRTELKDFLPLWWILFSSSMCFFSTRIGVIEWLTVTGKI